MSLKEIANILEFKDYGYMVGEMPGLAGRIMSNINLNMLCKLTKTWDAKTLAEGMEYLLQQAKQKKVFYDFWALEEKEKSPSKNFTGIAALTVPKKAKFAIICAGGGYASVCSMAEAYPIAMRLNQMGYSAFVVQYRVGKDAIAPNPMDDLAQATRFILKNAEKFRIDKDSYAMIGFSAGGHLVASMGTEKIGYKYYGIPKPEVLFLAYPVITMGEKTHSGSRRYLLGKSWKESSLQIEKYSIENQITSCYPPIFVWQFENDNTVPVENTKMLVESLKQNHIKNTYELFAGTAHGVGLGVGTKAEKWLEHAVSFWESL